MRSRGQWAVAQRSEEESEAEEWAAEQKADWQETLDAEEERLRVAGSGFGLPSQRMQVKGEHGNQTRSLPVSMYRETDWGGREATVSERV